MPLPYLLLDNYDSFTYNLYDYMAKLGAKVVVKRNDAPDLSDAFSQKWQGIVLSPGPKTPREAGRMMECIDIFYQKLPILGICLGHQAIGEFFGATLQKAAQPRHGKTSFITHNESQLFQNLPNPMQVMRYHSLVLTHFSEIPLHIAAVAIDDDAVMAFTHHSLPLYGVQFHPESILSPQGLALISNWLQMTH